MNGPNDLGPNGESTNIPQPNQSQGNEENTTQSADNSDVITQSGISYNPLDLNPSIEIDFSYLDRNSPPREMSFSQLYGGIIQKHQIIHPPAIQRNYIYSHQGLFQPKEAAVQQKPIEYSPQPTETLTQPEISPRIQQPTTSMQKQFPPRQQYPNFPMHQEFQMQEQTKSHINLPDSRSYQLPGQQNYYSPSTGFPFRQPQLRQVHYQYHIPNPQQMIPPPEQTVMPETKGMFNYQARPLINQKALQSPPPSTVPISNESTSSSNSLEFLTSAFLLVNLNDKMMCMKIIQDLPLQKETIKSLQIDCDGFSPTKQRHFLLILNSCPYVETLTLRFNKFCGNGSVAKLYDSHLRSFTSQEIKFSSLKNLSTFEFKCFYCCHHHEDTVVYKTYKDRNRFYLKIFKEIFKSSGNLKQFILRTVQGADYMRLMIEHSEIAMKLKKLHTFRLNIDSDSPEIKKLLWDILSNASSSLQIIHTRGCALTNLKDYPHIPNLRILCIQLFMYFSQIIFSVASFPKLETLILGHVAPLQDLNFNFGWPFDTEGGVKLNEDSLLSQTFSPQPLTVVVYEQLSLTFWEEGLHTFFTNLSQINVESIYIDLTFRNEVIDIEEECRHKRLHIFPVPISLKRCLVRYLKAEDFPVVFDVYKYFYKDRAVSTL